MSYYQKLLLKAFVCVLSYEY